MARSVGAGEALGAARASRRMAWRVSLARLELLLGSKGPREKRIGAVSEEFKERLRRLPVYVPERMIVSYWTGEPIDDSMELEQLIEADFDGDDEGPAD